jgi:hypothetical protein
MLKQHVGDWARTSQSMPDETKDGTAEHMVCTSAYKTRSWDPSGTAPSRRRALKGKVGARARIAVLF